MDYRVEVFHHPQLSFTAIVITALVAALSFAVAEFFRTVELFVIAPVC